MLWNTTEEDINPVMQAKQKDPNIMKTLNLGIMANFMTLISCICFSDENPEIPSHVPAPVDETCCRRQTTVFYRGVSNTTI